MEQITDPEDFQQKHIQNRKLDESLRCPICREFFSLPRTIPCGHTFCSSCIRNCGDYNQRNSINKQCPQCREQFQDYQLSNQYQKVSRTLENIIQQYQILRPELLQKYGQNPSLDVHKVAKVDKPVQTSYSLLASYTNDVKYNQNDVALFEQKEITPINKATAPKKYLDSSLSMHQKQINQNQISNNDKQSVKRVPDNDNYNFRQRKQKLPSSQSLTPSSESDDSSSGASILIQSQSFDNKQDSDNSSDDYSKPRSNKKLKTDNNKINQQDLALSTMNTQNYQVGDNHNFNSYNQNNRRQENGHVQGNLNSKQRQNSQQAPRGSVRCPLCNIPVTATFIQQHVETCLQKQDVMIVDTIPPPKVQQNPRKSADISNQRDQMLPRKSKTSNGRTLLQKDIPPKLVFNMMNSKQIKSQLLKLGLPTHGEKEELQNRYNTFRRYVTLAVDGHRSSSLKALVKEFSTNSAPKELQKIQTEQNQSHDITKREPLSGATASYKDLIKQTRERQLKQKLPNNSNCSNIQNSNHNDVQKIHSSAQQIQNNILNSEQQDKQNDNKEKLQGKLLYLIESSQSDQKQDTENLLYEQKEKQNEQLEYLHLKQNQNLPDFSSLQEGQDSYQNRLQQISQSDNIYLEAQ